MQFARTVRDFSSVLLPSSFGAPRRNELESGSPVTCVAVRRRIAAASLRRRPDPAPSSRLSRFDLGTAIRAIRYKRLRSDSRANGGELQAALIRSGSVRLSLQLRFVNLGLTRFGRHTTVTHTAEGSFSLPHCYLFAAPGRFRHVASVGRFELRSKGRIGRSTTPHAVAGESEAPIISFADRDLRRDPSARIVESCRSAFSAGRLRTQSPAGICTAQLPLIRSPAAF